MFLYRVIFFGKFFWRLGKRSFTEKAKIVNRGSLCSARESTCSELQYDADHLCCMFLDRVIHSGGNSVRLGKGLFSEKAKIVNRGSLCSARESTCSKLQYDAYHLCSMFLDLVIHSRGHSGRLGEGSFSDKFKIVSRGSICSEPESTGSKLTNDPNLISVPCSILR